MGAPNRLDFLFTKMIGFGVGFDTFPYQFNIAIVVPFVVIYVGLGKPYTDNKGVKK